MISVIVPIYNTAHFLQDCIQSILKQSYTDWELILVDDGSTDQSLHICHNIAEGNRHIHVFHQENSGVSKARKTGIEHAKGEFVCFVDSDDMLFSNALQVLADKTASDIDIVISDAKEEEVLTGQKYLEYCLLSRFQPFHGRLYRKSILEKSNALDVTRKIYLGEDIVGNIKAALYANRIATVTEHIYLFRNNLTSVSRTNRFTSDHAEMILAEVESVLKQKKGKEVLLSEAWYKFRLHLLTMLVLSHSDFSYQKSWINSLLHERVPQTLSANEKIVRYVRHVVLCRHLIGIQHRAWLLKKKFLKYFGKHI